jgi:hypothetical protein
VARRSLKLSELVKKLNSIKTAIKCLICLGLIYRIYYLHFTLLCCKHVYSTLADINTAITLVSGIYRAVSDMQNSTNPPTP